MLFLTLSAECDHLASIQHAAADAEIARDATQRVLPRLALGISWLRHNSSLAFEFMTAGLGVVAFVVAAFVPITQSTLVSLTIALLALLSISSLLQRITKLEHVDQRVKAVHNFIRGGELEAMVQTLSNSSTSAAKSLKEAGIVAVHRSLGRVDIAAELESATGSIRILSNWVGLLSDIDDILARKAEEGCSVQVLVLQHTADYAKMRNGELEWGDDEMVAKQIENDLKRFDRLLVEHPSAQQNLVVRAFDARPPICMFAYDDIRLVGFYWPKMDAMKGPFLRIVGKRNGGEGSPAFANITDYQFEELWRDERTRYVHLANGEPTYVTGIEQAWARGNTLRRVMANLRPASPVDRLANRDIAVKELRANDAEMLDVVAAGREAIQLAHMRDLLLLAGILEDADRTEEALQLLSEAVRQGYSSPLERYAPLLAKLDRLAEAESVLESYATNGVSVARHWLVKLLDATERQREANAMLRDWATRGDLASRHVLVSRMIKSGRLDEAEDLLRGAPNDQPSRQQLIQLLATLDRKDEVVQLLESRSPRSRTGPSVESTRTSGATPRH
jgi:hypothetical protein